MFNKKIQFCFLKSMYSTGESQEEEGPVHPLLPIYMLTKQ